MPLCRESINRGRSSMGNRNVPVQVPPCQMLNTAIPVSAYQLRRMLRVLPRTSKKTSPSRGSGAASDADMLPMVAPLPNVCPVRTEYCSGASRVTQSWLSVMAARDAGVSPPVRVRPSGRKILATRRPENHPPPCANRGRGGIIVRRLPAPACWGAPSFGNTGLREHRLVGQAFVMHEPASAACLRAQPVERRTRTPKRAGTLRRHAALDLATAVTAQG
jgi:hypothetical protein